jgi:lysyl-tRNA synthetase class 2
MRTSRRHVVLRRVVALLTLVVGLVNVTIVVRPGIFHRLEFLTDLLPGALVSASAAVSVAVGLLLVGLSVNLGRGKRRAWRIALVLLAVEVVLQLSLRHYATAVASGVLIVVLLVENQAFIGRSESVARSRALIIGAGMLVASVLLGFLALTALDDHVGAGLRAGERLVATLQGLVGVNSVLTAPDTVPSDAVYYLLIALSSLTLLVTGGLILQAPRLVEPRSPEDEQALRHLVARFGGSDSLSYFALRDDRSLVWGPGRRSCVSFRRVGSTMLAAGDPLGPPAEWQGVVEAFVAQARRDSAVPAVVACSEAGAQAYARYGGLTALEFGDEAVLHADSYSLEGRHMRNVRQAVTRAERSGLTVEVSRLADVDGEHLAHLTDLADLWRGAAVERGFSMALGRVDVTRDPDSVVVTAQDGDVVRALLVLVPWGRDGLSLDLMRRETHAISGVNELMISRLMQRAPDLGVARVSLNFAVFREAIERSERFGAGPLTRLWGRVLRLASRGTQVDSLYRFNAKFSPTWGRRFLLFPSAVGLPRVTWAYLRAESFVPSLARRRTPRAAPTPTSAPTSTPTSSPTSTPTAEPPATAVRPERAVPSPRDAGRTEVGAP